MFQCFPTNLGQNTLLRIHADRFSPGNPKERSVKLIHLVQKTSRFCGYAPRRIRVRIVIRLCIPPILRHRADRVLSLAQQPPYVSGPPPVPGIRHPIPITAIGSCRFCSSCSSFDCSSTAKRARRFGDSFSIRRRKSLTTILPASAPASGPPLHPTDLRYSRERPRASSARLSLFSSSAPTTWL